MTERMSYTAAEVESLIAENERLKEFVNRIRDADSRTTVSRTADEVRLAVNWLHDVEWNARRIVPVVRDAVEMPTQEQVGAAEKIARPFIESRHVIGTSSDYAKAVRVLKSAGIDIGQWFIGQEPKWCEVDTELKLPCGTMEVPK